MSSTSSTIVSRSPEETHAIGQQLAYWLRPGDVVLLHGDLGAGKTQLVRGVLEGLASPQPVSSPTFILVHQHDGVLPGGGRVRVSHIDLYRLDADAADQLLEEIGLEPDAILLVEWPERLGAPAAEPFLLVTLDVAGPSQRRIRFCWYGANDRELPSFGNLGTPNAAP